MKKDNVIKGPVLEFKSTLKTFDVDWEKITTLDDVKSLLKGFQFTVFLQSDEIPEHLKEIFEKGFIKERLDV